MTKTTMSESRDLFVGSRDGDQIRLGARCAECGGMGRQVISAEESSDCDRCCGLGWFGIDPLMPVAGYPGTVEKVAMLSVRYASGSPMWHPQDGHDGERYKKPEPDEFPIRPAAEHRDESGSEAAEPVATRMAP